MVLLGDTGVGKSSLIDRFIHDTFGRQETSLGSSYSSKTVSIGLKEVKFSIWDTAGQEQYRSLSSLYYRDADVALLVFDVTSSQSFEVVDYYLTQLKQHAKSDISICSLLPKWCVYWATRWTGKPEK